MRKTVAMVCFGVAAVGCWTLLACRKSTPKSESRVLYFRDVDVNGHYDIIGVFPVPAESAAFGECYECDYSDGRLTKVTHLQNGRAIDGSYFGDSVAVVEVTGDGRRASWIYHGADWEAARDRNGVQAIVLNYAADGTRLYVCNYALGASYREGATDLDVAPDSLGVAVYVWQLDSAGNRTTCVFGNDLGWRIARQGVWSLRLQYDARRRLRYAQYFNRDGTNCERSGSGIAGISATYDVAGQVTDVRNFGTDGRLKNDNRSGVAVTQTQYDNRGLAISRRTYDALLRPTPDRSTGVAGLEWNYDARCRQVREARFNPNGSLCEDTTGVAVWSREYDEEGNLLEESFFDGAGGPVEVGQHRAAKVRYAYDSLGNVLEESYYGRDGLPKSSAENGAAIVRASYDAEGEPLERRYYDVRGNLSDSDLLGVARVRFGIPVRNGDEDRYYGRDGRLKGISGRGYAIVRRTRWARPKGEWYDHSDESYYGADSSPMETDLGVATVRHISDTMPGIGATTVFLDKNGNVLW